MSSWVVKFENLKRITSYNKEVPGHSAKISEK